MSKLKEYLSIKHGWAFKGEYFAESGIQCILTPGNFYEKGGFKENSGKERYYSGDYPDEYLCSKGDLIIAMTEQAAGLLGSTAIVPEDNKYLHNQRIGLISCYEDKLDKTFAYYMFMTRSVREQIRGSSSGTKVKHTSPEKIYDVEVNIPDLTTQKKIANLLWLLDKKIQLNQVLSKESEKVLEHIFQRYFIQFEYPTITNNNYRLSGGKLKYITNLDSNIPINWETTNLYDIANFYNGIACQKYRPTSLEKGLPVVKIREMRDGISENTEIVTENIDSTHIINNGDILFSWSASLEVMLWIGGTAALNQHIFKVVPKEEFSPAYVYQQLKFYIINFIRMAESRKTTMGHITTDHLNQSCIVKPSKDVLENFDKVAMPIFNKIIAVQEEILHLEQMRYKLLPLLMNGQVTIN